MVGMMAEAHQATSRQNGPLVSSSSKDESLDSISATLAQVMRLSGSRSMFARQAETAGVVLTQPSYLLLRILIDDGPRSMGTLARAAHMDVGMATRQVGALVDAGLATRDPDPADARVILIAVTAAGRRVAGALQEVRRIHLQRALSGWTATDVAEFDRLLTRFLNDTVATPFED